MNSTQQLCELIDSLQEEVQGKVTVTVLPSQVRRKRKSALGVKTHSSNGRRWNNENCAVVPVA